MLESLLPAPTTTVAQQWHAFQHDTILFDATYFAPLGITSNERVDEASAKFLHNFCTNDVKSLKEDQSCEAFFCNEKGRILAHALILCDTLRFWILTSPDRCEFLLAHLDKYVLNEDFQLGDLRESDCFLYAAGPQAGDFLFKTFDAYRMPEVNELEFLELGGEHVTFVRWDCWDQPGYLLMFSRSDAPQIMKMLTSTDVIIGSNEVAEIARVAAGFPKYGVDLSEENLAQEANRTQQAISFDKGCYLGQEPIARIDALGHINRELVVVTCTADEPLQVGAKLFDPATEKELGTLTSSATIQETSTQLGIAMLRTTHSKAGTEIRIQTEAGEMIPANVSCS